jgi:hypothetical protein
MFVHTHSRCSMLGRTPGPGLHVDEHPDQSKIRHDVERAVERERGR